MGEETLWGSKATSLFLSIKKKLNLFIGRSVCVFRGGREEQTDAIRDWPRGR